MQYRRVSTDDVDELFTWGDGWDSEFLQLTRGPLGFTTQGVSLPDLHIEMGWNRVAKRTTQYSG